jgi:hypothetical protein
MANRFSQFLTDRFIKPHVDAQVANVLSKSTSTPPLSTRLTGMARTLNSAGAPRPAVQKEAALPDSSKNVNLATLPTVEQPELQEPIAGISVEDGAVEQRSDPEDVDRLVELPIPENDEDD